MTEKGIGLSVCVSPLRGSLDVNLENYFFALTAGIVMRLNFFISFIPTSECI